MAMEEGLQKELRPQGYTLPCHNLPQTSTGHSPQDNIHAVTERVVQARDYLEEDGKHNLKLSIFTTKEQELKFQQHFVHFYNIATMWQQENMAASIPEMTELILMLYLNFHLRVQDKISINKISINPKLSISPLNIRNLLHF